MDTKPLHTSQEDLTFHSDQESAIGAPLPPWITRAPKPHQSGASWPIEVWTGQSRAVKAELGLTRGED
jgi:hypothetical protein